MAQPARQVEIVEDIDPFMESMNRLLNWAKENQKRLIVWAIVIFVLIAAAAGAAFYYNHAQNRAATLLGKAMMEFRTARSNNGPFAAYETIKGELKEVMDKYGYTDAGKMALIQYAGVCCFSGDYDKAIGSYEKAFDKYGDNPMLKDLIISGLAYGYAGKKDFKNAISWFEKIAQNPDATGQDEALFNLGLIYGQTGQTEKSRSAFKRIVSDFPGSIYLNTAKQNLAG
ncbi:MAG: tetratricopeptide repeat protein [Deltaproteobacteria bacterium]|nr:tetratricopeptide repeat protein [Deltaproteobacteria bacterium]